MAVSVAVVMMLAVGSPAWAQGGATSSLTGTVVDTSGAVVPGADIVAKNVATGAVYTAVSGANGTFLIPALPPGTYTATISLLGFKTAELKDIIVNVAVAASVKATLALGEITETVVVTGAQEIVQTQATAVSTTLNMKQIASLPMPGRGAFDLVSYMPGVTTTTGSIRDSTVNGLPQSSVNITLDGMNIQDNYAKSWDGMFTRVSPRLDAVEEVTVSTAASGADQGGQGAAQVRFVTRSGTNRFLGSGYYYYRRDWMNTNTWFNLHQNIDAVTGKATARPTLFQDQPGGRLGGPIIKDKAFFFVNYEWISSPGMVTNTRTIMSPLSQQGIFQYGGGRSVNLMALAAANGHMATVDPVIAKLLADVRTSAAKAALTPLSDPAVERLSVQQKTKSQTKYPTVRLDYQVTTNHRLSFSVTQNHLISNPDTTNSGQRVFPDFPVTGLQDSVRYTTQLSLRSVLSKNMVNELRLGGTGGATQFSPNLNVDMYSNTAFGNMAGYGIIWNAFKAISNPYNSSSNSAREGSTRVVEDTLNWLKGKHSFSMGASVTRGDVWLQNQQLVPTVRFGLITGDPADAMFTSANFPGAGSTDITAAKALYAVLTGRIQTITREVRIGEDGKTYNLLGKSMQKGRMWQVGAFVQDGWRIRPNLTANIGLRYEVALPFYALNNSYSMATIDDIFGRTGVGSGLVVGSTVNGLGNLFKPGVQQGAPSTYKMLTKGADAYKTDWNNVAPSIGIAWTTGAESGILHKLLGNPGDAVIRAGYNISYQRGGMSDYTEVYGDNPGIRVDAIRNLANGNLGTLPVLFSSSNLGPAADTPSTREYPMSVPSVSSNIRIFDPAIKLPYATSGTLGLQRAISKDMAIEIRFIHTTSHDGWTLRNLGGALNYNEVNIIENGFLDEFKKAQANLVANINAGKSSSGFAYTGAPGTVPLPIFLANLNGSADASNPAAYSGSGWSNTTITQNMYYLNPNPQSVASTLRNNATYKTNMGKAGLPFNFWVVNPDVNVASAVTNGPSTRYNAVNLGLNRRFSKGLSFQANYTFGKGWQTDFFSFHKPYVERQQTYTNGTASMGNVVHTFSLNWMYELPFGRGRKFGSDAGAALDRLIGGWSLMGVARAQSGRMVDFGNVRLMGFDEKDLEKMYKLRQVTDPQNKLRTLVFMLPQDVIDNTVKAFSFDAKGYTAGAPTGRYFAPANGPDCIESVTGYGDCGARSVVVTGPKVIRVDLTLAKQLPIKGRVNAEFQAMMFNVFNRVNFNPVTWSTSGSGAAVSDSYQITGAVDQSRTMQLAFRISF